MYYLIARFQNRKSSDIIIKKGAKKDDKEIKQLLIEYRDKHGFTKQVGYTLFIRKV